MQCSISSITLIIRSKSILSPRNNQGETKASSAYSNDAETVSAQDVQESAKEEVAPVAEVAVTCIKTEEIESLKAALKAKEEELNAKDEEIEKINAAGSPAQVEEIATLTAELASRDELIQGTARKLIPAALAAKDAKIAALNSRIETEQTSFEKSNAEKLQEIANNNAEITSLNKIMAQQT